MSKFPKGYVNQDLVGELQRIKRKLGWEYDRLVLIFNGHYMASVVAIKGKQMTSWTPLLDQTFVPLGNSIKAYAEKVETTVFKPKTFEQGKVNALDEDIFITKTDVTPVWWQMEVVNGKMVSRTDLKSIFDLNLGGK